MIIERVLAKRTKPKIIAWQVPPDKVDVWAYFVCDSFSPAAGNFGYTIFVPPTRRHDGYNADLYKRLESGLEEVLTRYEKYEEPMQYVLKNAYIPHHDTETLSRNSQLVGKLKKWAEKEIYEGFCNDIDRFAAYLSIITGEEWISERFVGFSRRESVTLIYCPNKNREGIVREFADMWLGDATEFFIEDEDGRTYGYYAHSGIGRKDIKDYLADAYGCQPEELEVQLFKDYEVKETPIYEVLGD